MIDEIGKREKCSKKAIEGATICDEVRRKRDKIFQERQRCGKSKARCQGEIEFHFKM